MAVCNIFNQLKNSTGTFLMFSQYVEDLTRCGAQSIYYKVSPSKFITANINYFDPENGVEHNNDSIPRELQNRFENGCAVCRKELKDFWTPNQSTNLFWNALFDMNLLTKDADGFINEINYVGDINLQSYNEHDGIGYSEIYCYIPNEAKEQKCYCDVDNGNGDYLTSGETIEGYSENELGNDWEMIGDNLLYYPNKSFEFPWSNDGVEFKVIESNEFNINTIILLYDILTKTDEGFETLYKDVPMGIYFTGLIPNYGGEMTNKITKYVSNDSIFGVGTSYGLRICSRFTVTPNQASVKVLDITTDNDNYSAISMVMAQMAKSQSKMDDVIEKIQSNTSAEKELLAIFKNSRTNVPYLKTVNGTSHWFVNGRRVGSILGDLEYEYEPYESEEIMDMMRKNATLYVSLTAADVYGNTVFDLSEIDNVDIKLQWSTLLNNFETYPDRLILNHVQFDPNITNTTMNEVMKTTTYKVEVEKDGLSADASATVYFEFPTYFGQLPCNHTCGEDYIHEFNPSIDDIKDLQKHVYITKGFEYKYDNIANEHGDVNHIVLAYPKSFGNLSSIMDKYGYEYIDDFHVYEKIFTFGSRQVEYLVYADKIPAEVNNFEIKFT